MRSLIIVFLFFISFTASPANRFYNGDLEIFGPYLGLSLPAGFTVVKSPTVTNNSIYPASGYSGYGFRLSAANISGGSLWFRNADAYPVDVAPSETVTLSFKYKCNASWKLKRDFISGSGGHSYANIQVFTVNDNVWRALTTNITVNSNTQNLSIGPVAQTNGGCTFDDFYID